MDRHQNLVSGLKVLDLVAMVSCFALAAALIAPGLHIATIRAFMGHRISVGNFILFGSLVLAKKKNKNMNVLPSNWPCSIIFWPRGLTR